MNVLMIEHEKGRVKKIKELLQEIDDSIHVVGVADTINGAAEWLTRNRVPDIILANKGMLAAAGHESPTDISATVTFTTNTGEYDFHAFRYKTIRHILSTLHGRYESLPGGSILPSTPTPSAFKERFLVKQGQKLLSVPVNQIAYFFSQDRFIFFRTFDNQKFLLEYRIEQLEELISPERFFRVNRSLIVSLPSVREIHAWFGNRLKLYLSPAADKDVIVSRKRVTEFKEWLGK